MSAHVPLVTLSPSPVRRIAAAALLGGTGTLLLAVVLLQPPASMGLRLYLLGFGALALYLTGWLWRATASGVVLTDAGLFDTGGRCLCPFDNIDSVERGLFAFKPSNGFLVHMKQPRRRGWAPGLWWSVGRRLGIGGVTPAAQGRIMADLLAVKLAGDRTPAKNR